MLELFRKRTSPTHPLGLAVLFLATLLLASACAKERSDTELAAEALQAGLKAQAAGRLDEAAADYQEVLLHDPQNKFAYYNLGLIDQTRDDAQSAESHYRLAIGVDPNFVPALYNLAIIRTAAGDAEEAIELYRRATQADPNYAPAHLNLGFLLIEAGRENEGRAELDLAVQLDPSLADRIPEGSAGEGGTEPKPEPSP